MSKHRKRAATVTEEALPETRSVEALTAEEERALRMRTGRPLSDDAPLARKAPDGSAAAQTLLRMEAELMLAMRRRAESVELENEEATPVDSAAKSKIVRALRKKS